MWVRRLTIPEGLSHVQEAWEKKPSGHLLARYQPGRYPLWILYTKELKEISSQYEITACGELTPPFHWAEDEMRQNSRK